VKGRRELSSSKFVRQCRKILESLSTGNLKPKQTSMWLAGHEIEDVKCRALDDMTLTDNVSMGEMTDLCSALY